MLQLQKYERLLKAMVALSELIGPPEGLQEKVTRAHRKNPGTFVRILNESYLKLPSLPDDSEQAEAETKLAQVGWSPLFEAIRWIAKTCPSGRQSNMAVIVGVTLSMIPQQFEIRKQS